MTDEKPESPARSRRSKSGTRGGNREPETAETNNSDHGPASTEDATVKPAALDPPGEAQASGGAGLAAELGGHQVGTVGRLDLHPDLVNGVAARATMTGDRRNPDDPETT